MADLVPRLAQGLLDELAAALRIVIVNGPRQFAGLVLHLGQRTSSFGDNIYAVPVSALWGHARP